MRHRILLAIVILMVGFAAIVSVYSNRSTAIPVENVPAHGPEVPGVSQACLHDIQQAANSKTPTTVSPDCM